MAETVFLGVASSIGLLEALAWGVHAPPYTAHDKMSIPVKAIQITLNSVPHLVAAAALRGGQSFPAWYLPYAAFFCAGQASNWWLPYFFGLRGPRTAELFNHVSKTAKLLPPLGDRPAPSGEHTVLFPLSVSAFGLGAHLFLQLPRAERVGAAHAPATLAVGCLAAALGASAGIFALLPKKRGESSPTKKDDDGGEEDPDTDAGPWLGLSFSMLIGTSLAGLWFGANR
jgi:hypothetical protein|eukprot:jgi/Chrpa1/27990/Chrysochromulina_OHIO_Genome00013744-RA